MTSNNLTEAARPTPWKRPRMSAEEKDACRRIALEEAAVKLAAWYPDNANTGAFCAAIRSMKSSKPEDE